MKDAEAKTYFRQVLCGDSIQTYPDKKPTLVHEASAHSRTDSSFISNKVGRAFLNEERMLNTVQSLYQGHGRGAELTGTQGTAWGCCVQSLNM